MLEISNQVLTRQLQVLVDAQVDASESLVI